MFHDLGYSVVQRSGYKLLSMSNTLLSRRRQGIGILRRSSSAADGELVEVNAILLGRGMESVLGDGLQSSGGDSHTNELIPFLPP